MCIFFVVYFSSVKIIFQVMLNYARLFSLFFFFSWLTLNFSVWLSWSWRRSSTFSLCYVSTTFLLQIMLLWWTTMYYYFMFFWRIMYAIIIYFRSKSQYLSFFVALSNLVTVYWTFKCSESSFMKIVLFILFTLSALIEFKLSKMFTVPLFSHSKAFVLIIFNHLHGSIKMVGPYKTLM